MEIVKNISNIIYTGLIGAVVLSLVSCYPNSGLETEDLDVALSFYDETVNFDNFNTYSMPDSVVVLDELSNRRGVGNFDAEILSLVRNNLSSLGYVEEADPANNVPDVLVLVSKVVNNNVEAYSFYDWWGYYSWYPYWGAYPYPYGGGWSPYYPWGGTVVYSYKTGTVLIEMIHVAASNESSKQLQAVWAGAINGLLEGTDAEINTRLNSSVNQVFDQSPYLRTN